LARAKVIFINKNKNYIQKVTADIPIAITRPIIKIPIETASISPIIPITA
jgi:hypothetical protein